MLGVDRINRLLGQAKIISKNASAYGALSCELVLERVLGFLQFLRLFAADQARER